jgi:hypothetical protein
MLLSPSLAGRACAFALLLALIAAPTASARRARQITSPTGSTARARVLRAYREYRAIHGHSRDAQQGTRVLARAAVVGGVERTIEQLPWQVVVFAEFEAKGKQSVLLCGGSIVDLSHVVTAGHCTYNPATGQPIAAEDFELVAGASTITMEEIKHGATVQVQPISAVRRHPFYDYAAGAGTPDDVAVLTLGSALRESAGVKPIALPSAQLFPPEGVAATFSGFGAESATARELNGSLYSLETRLESSAACGGAVEADFLCARTGGGSACSGDSGGGLTDQPGGTLTLIGVVDFLVGSAREPCLPGNLNGFANVTAPEIRDFIEGSESPPLAPRGGSALLRGEPMVGQVLTCEPSEWSNGPTFTYTFLNSAREEVLQRGVSATYTLTAADLGRTIWCQLTASTPGGTAAAGTPVLSPVGPSSGARASVPPGAPPPAAGTGPISNPMEEGLPGQGVGSLVITEIRALLRGELAPRRGAATLARVLKSGGYTIAFNAPEAGAAVVKWYRPAPKAHLGKKRKAKPIAVASGTLTFSEAGVKKLKLELTPAGRSLLEHSRRLSLTATGTFTPEGQTAIGVTRHFVLR